MADLPLHRHIVANPLRKSNNQAAWNANAAFWDERMGDAGNDFVNVLIWPPTERLLDLLPGQSVLTLPAATASTPAAWRRAAPRLSPSTSPSK